MMTTSGMGYKILDERYALLECLAVSGVGEIYRGRDLELTQTEHAPSRILIHLLPSHYPSSQIEAYVMQAQQTIKQLNKPWILPILAQGKDGDRHYFILHSPESLGAHSVMSLPSAQLPSASKLAQQFSGLIKAKQLPETIDSALLIALPNQSLYVLGTAFIAPIHALRAPHMGLTLYKRPMVKGALALSSIMAITLSTFAVEYRAAPERAHHEQAHSVDAPITSPQELLAQTEHLTVHASPKIANLVSLPLALQEPVPALEPTLVVLPKNTDSLSANKTALNPAPSTQLKLMETASPTDKNVEKPKLTANNLVENSKEMLKPKATTEEKVAKNTAVLNPTGQQQRVDVRPTANEATYYTASFEMPSPALPKKKSATQAPQTLSLDELVTQANKALDAQNFSSKNGVIFYTRQIKIINHLHPQVERLGRFTVMYQHDLARNMLKADEPERAHTLLNTSKNLIQEFNLKSLNSAQEVLEHKFNQYN